MCKANLASYRNEENDNNKKKIVTGVNVAPNLETIELAPYLCDKDYELCTKEVFDSCDYVALNF